MSTPGVRRPRPAKPEGFVEPHDHTAADKGGSLVLGSIPDDALGSGSGGLGTKFLRDDRTWANISGGGGTPTSPAASIFIHLLADAGLGLSAGDPVTTWADQSGNGRDFVGSGTSRPTFRSDDLGDGLPFVEFDGVNDYLLMSGSPAFNQPEITVQGVLRFAISGGTFPGVLSLSGASGADWNNTGRSSIETGNSGAKRIQTTRNSIPTDAPHGFVNGQSDGATWGIFTLSTRSALGGGVTTLSWYPWWSSQKSLGPTPPDWTFTHVAMGARWIDAAASNHNRCDWRELLIYDRALNGLDLSNNIKYLASRWGIPGI